MRLEQKTEREFDFYSRRRFSNPEVVFHAAALKHLPMLQQYPEEAWKTNVIGTLNVLKAIPQEALGQAVAPGYRDLRRLAWLKGYPIVPCGCPLCGASVLESRRAQVKALVAQLRESIPDIKHSMLKAMKNVKTSHLLDLRLPPIT